MPHKNCFQACGTNTSNQVTRANGARQSKQIQTNKKPGCYSAVILASTKIIKMALTGTKRNDGKVSKLWYIENENVSLRQPKWYTVLEENPSAATVLNAVVYTARDIGNPSLLRGGKGI